MRIKQTPADFVVEEQLGQPVLPAGPYAILRVEKRDVTTAQVQAEMAAALGVPRSAVAFPALKDRRAYAIQHATVKGNPRPHLEGDKWHATRAGQLDRPLRPTDIAANRFAITLRDLSPGEAGRIPGRLREMAEGGLPNYFDAQRFGSWHPEDGLIGGHILARNPERALRAHLALPYPGDPAAVRAFKQEAAAHWGDWQRLFDAAPRPSNYRSVLTYLRDHPADWRKALNLLPRQLLSLYLEAYQSHLWNRIAGRWLVSLLAGQEIELDWIEIAGTALPLGALPAGLREQLRYKTVIMPHHRAAYREPGLAEAVTAVLREEGLALADLKARILQKAYLTRHARPLLLFPADATTDQPQPDDRFPGRLKLAVFFTLSRGSYATLVVRCADRG